MLLIQYKEPRGYTIAEGKLDGTIEDFFENSGYNTLKLPIPDCGDILIPVDRDCHISFIRELSEEEYKRYKDMEKGEKNE